MAKIRQAPKAVQNQTPSARGSGATPSPRLGADKSLSLADQIKRMVGDSDNPARAKIDARDHLIQNAGTLSNADIAASLPEVGGSFALATAVLDARSAAGALDQGALSLVDDIAKKSPVAEASRIRTHLADVVGNAALSKTAGATLSEVAQKTAHPIEHMAISGLSLSGLSAAYGALFKAKDVGLKKLTLIDIRPPDYSREIGFNMRPEFLKLMIVMNPKAAKELFAATGITADAAKAGNVLRRHNPETGAAEPMDSKVLQELHDLCAKLEGGDVSLADREAYVDKVMSNPTMADFAHDVMFQDAVTIITCKDFENIFNAGLKEAAAERGVELDIHRGNKLDVEDDATTGKQRFVITPAKGEATNPVPLEADFVLVGEGAGGARTGTRAVLGKSKMQEVTPKQRWIAGVVDPKTTPEHGLGRYAETQTPDGQTLRAVRSDHAKTGKQWRLVQLPDNEVLEPVPFEQIPKAEIIKIAERLGIAHTHPDFENQCERAFFGQRVEQRYTELTSVVGELPDDCDIYNAFGSKSPPAAFTLQGVAHDDVVLAGDPRGPDDGLPPTISLGDNFATSTFNVSAGGLLDALGSFYSTVELLQGAAENKHSLADLVGKMDESIRGFSFTWVANGITQFDGDPKELAQEYLPKELLEKNMPAHVVAHYYNDDGSLRKDPQAKYWKSWMKHTAQEEQGISVPADIAKGTLDGMRDLVGKDAKATPPPMDSASV